MHRARAHRRLTANVHLQAGSKADTRKAAAKLERIANIANTLRFTLQARQ